MPSLKTWLQTDSDTPPPFTPDPEQMQVNRRQIRSLLASQPAPAAVEVPELTPLQLSRAVERNSSPQQIYRLIRQGTPLPRLANALGLPLESIQRIYRQQKTIHQDSSPLGQAVQMQQRGLTFPQIGEKLGVSEAEARMLYARGHVKHFGANPAVQIGRKAGTPFPGGIFPPPTYQRETNRDSASLNLIISQLKQELEPQGLRLETRFEADALGGRHVIRVVRNGETIGQPFRLSATPSDVPLVSKTGRGAGGYRLAYPGQATPLTQRLSSAIRTMVAHHGTAQTPQANPDWPLDDEAPLDEGYSASDPGFDVGDTMPPPPRPLIMTPFCRRKWRNRPAIPRVG